MSRIIRKDQSGAIIVPTGNTLPEAGRIKVGITVPGKTSAGKDYARPTSLDYFRATGTMAERFHQTFGAQPKTLTVVFVSEDINEVCNQRYECWDNGKRYGWGDGDSFTVWDANAGELKNNKPVGAYIEVKKGNPLLSGHKWDEMLTLRFILPDIKGVLGQWSFTTKGAKAVIPSLIKSFDFIRERAGRVSGIPFEFSVEKVKGYSPGEARQYSKVKLIPVITAHTVEKVRDFLASGQDMASIAPILLNEAKLNDVKYIDAPHVEIIEDKQDTPKKFTVDKDGTVRPVATKDAELFDKE